MNVAHQQEYFHKLVHVNHVVFHRDFSELIQKHVKVYPEYSVTFIFMLLCNVIYLFLITNQKH
jgi:hypothetical protein